MLIGVVRGGDDDAGIRPLQHGEVGHSRGGNGTQRHHICTQVAKARHKCGFQHIRGDPGILAQGDHRTAAGLLFQHHGNGLAHAKGLGCGQGLAYDTTDPVSSK